MKNYSERIAALSPDQRELLKIKLGQQKKGISSNQITRRNRQERVSWPLSFDQERLWFVKQLHPFSSAYNISLAFKLSGPLNILALKQSLDEIVARHEILRTAFIAVDEQPEQFVSANLTLSVAEIDLEDSPHSDWEESIKNVFAQHAALPFNLAEAPLMRAILLRNGPSEFALLVTMHHIVTDWWSVNLFQKEVTLLYGAFSTGQPSPLLELPIQYADFAYWQRQTLKGSTLEGLLSYWDKQLADAPLVLELPTDRPRPQVQRFRGKIQPVNIDRNLYHALKLLGREEQATGFMVMLAAFMLFIYRYTGQENFLVGSPSANRSAAGTENLIGYFLNTMVLRADLGSMPSVREILRQVRDVVLGAYAHQDMPFGELVKRLLRERDLSRMPLVQVCLIFLMSGERSAIGELSATEVEGLRFTPLNVQEGTGRYDLTLGFWETQQGPIAQFEYDSDLFDASTINRMSRQIGAILRAMVAEPDAKLSMLPLLSEDERYQVLFEWNNTRADYPDACVHHLFEAQAAKMPDSMAVVLEDHFLTYSELNNRANRLAFYLQSLGVGPEAVVAIIMDRCIDLVVGLLAVLKAGGAYVPLSPSEPKKRLSYLLEDIGSEVLLANRAVASDLHLNDSTVVWLDDDWDTIMHQSAENPPVAVTARNAAYVIYTSGSTGTPNGVVVEHLQLVNYVRAIIERFELPHGSSFATVANFTVDLGYTALFHSLCAGGTLHVISDDRARDPVALSSYLRRHSIDSIKITPSHLGALLESVGPAEVLPQELLVVGGEACTWSIVEKVRESGAACRIINHYGPTETTVGVLTCRVEDVSSSEVGTVPIGRPLANTQVYLLDGNLHPAPIGVPAEIHIGGAGLARAYLDHQELTAEKFIPNPFSDQPGSRLYRTGDIARLLDDGNVTVLGRADDQMKIRGFRVDLNEISSSLKQHPGVQDAVVLAGESRGDQRLVAYIVPDQQTARPIRELLRFNRTGLLAGRSTYELPNGLVVVHKNKNETDFMYREIFEEQVYVRNGIRIEEGDVIFDVGANIGLFSLYAGDRWKNVNIYAFEPIKPLFEILRLNAEMSGLNIRSFQCGLSKKNGVEKFTYYPHATLMSGLYADKESEKHIVKQFEKNLSMAAATAQQWNDELFNDLLDERLASEQMDSEVKTISELLEDEGIERLDLLKIDIQKSELDLLEGIRESDWSKIKQIVMEVHDQNGRLGKITEELAQRGFSLKVRQESALKNTNQFQVYAVRRSQDANPNARGGDPNIVPQTSSFKSTNCLITDVQRWLRERLPDYMQPATYMVMESLPLTSAGKINRQALPEPVTAADGGSYVAARSPAQQILASIWAEVLGRPLVGINDNFFELGGHSLRAIQVMSRLRKAFNLTLPVRVMFDKPTIAELSIAVELALRGAAARPEPAMKRVSRAGKLRLSYAQQRLWFIEQLERGGGLYNMAVGLRLKGVLDVRAMEQAIEEVRRRHEVLRTSFRMGGGEPEQVIGSETKLPLGIVDLSAIADEQVREQEAARQAKLEASRGFDLEMGPMVRVGLVRLAGEDHVLLITMHHIVSDGWSVEVMMREVEQLYAGYVKGEQVEMAEPEIQYADYGEWQREWLEGGVIEEEVRYWEEQLRGMNQEMKLPRDRRRAREARHKGGQEWVEVGNWETEKLREMSRQEGATMYMVLLGAMKALMYLYSGEEDVVIGTPVANRDRAEIEPLIGFFVNTLVIRTTVTGALTFRELIRKVRTVSLNAYAHQAMPFERLVEELQPGRHLNVTPLFQVMFMFQNVRSGTLKLPGLTITPIEADESTAKFDLTLSMTEERGGLVAAFNYDRDLFDQTTIQRMAKHFKRTLSEVAKDPDKIISTLALLDEIEQQQILVAWNDTSLDYESESYVHEMIQEQTRAIPDSVAVIYQDQEITYGELNRRANQLARYLIASGVGPDTLVGICLNRCIEMVIGLLAIMKAGGAYLPLDMPNPPERLKYMFREGRPHLLLTERQLAETIFRDEPGAICLDCNRENISLQRDGDFERHVDAENLAYAIFTSGSTGRPKCVQVRRRSLVNFISYMRSLVGLSREDSIAAITTLSFDICGLEIFLPLCAGARLFLVDRDTALDGEKLVSQIQSGRVTALQATPATWRMLFDSGWEGDKQLKSLCGGELLSQELASKLLASCGSVRNLYGPTETTIWSTFHELQDASQSSCIGKPIANTQIYLLNTRLQPVPVGVTGELHIGGEGVARGYLNQPELTADRFMPDPFAEKSGARLYRTGDLGRHLHDGNVEFLGRTDHQVKVRGFRIELGEIECVLRQHPDVKEAVIVVSEAESEQKQLIAYILANESGVDTRKISAYLKRELPDYMQPATYMVMESLPLTSAGKINRQALPEPVTAADGGSYVAARTPAQQILASIWAEVLGRPSVGINDNFFELGGHSLRAIQVMSRLRKAFNLTLPVRVMFDKPTIAELSIAVEMALRGAAARPEPAMKRVSRAGKLRLSYAQQRLWFIEQLEPGGGLYNMAVGLRLKGVLDVRAMEQAIEEVRRRHEVLRTSFRMGGGEPEQVISSETKLPLGIVDLSAIADEQVREQEAARQAKLEASRGFDLEMGPMVRVGLVRLAGEDHVLLITMHHIVSDGWSVEVMMREMEQLYGGYVKGEQVEMAEPEIQYADYAEWQREWLEGGVIEEEVRYWEEQLRGMNQEMKLPRDRRRAREARHRGGQEWVEVGNWETEKLREMSRQEGATMYMVLLGAMKALMYLYSGEEDVVIGTPVANRDRAEIEPLIGFFVNILVLRTIVSEDLTFRQLLSRVRETVLGAHTHGHLPYEKLIALLRPERKLTRNPLFQVLFSLEDAPEPPHQVEGLTFSRLQGYDSISHVDLRMNLVTKGDSLVASLSYDRDLFDRDTVVEMLGNYRSVIEQVVSNPDICLNEILLASDDKTNLPGVGLEELNRAIEADARDEFAF